MTVAVGIGIGVNFGSFLASNASRLLAGGQGLAFDFSIDTPSMVINDSGTPANAFSGDPNSKLTYPSPATKWIVNKSGVLVSGTTLRTEFDAYGAALGLRVEAAGSNSCLWSSDVTNASWTKSGVTALKNATGPDGVANSASTLTPSSSSDVAYQYQVLTLSGSAAVLSAWMRSTSGSVSTKLGINGSGANPNPQLSSISVTPAWAKYESPLTIVSGTGFNGIIGWYSGGWSP